MNSKASFNPHSAVLLKQALRIELKQKRQALNQKRQQQASEEAYRFIKKAIGGFATVLSFASFRSELNLWSLNQDLAQENRLVLPRLINNQLQLFQVTDLCQLELNSKGFLEPSITLCLSIEINKIDLILVPGLGFDLITKHRLGYGLGCYDQLLAQHLNIKTWGIGYFEQQVSSLPFSEKDIPLNQIYLF